jgi:hypothetical protein
MRLDEAWTELVREQATSLFDDKQWPIVKKYKLTEAELDELTDRVLVATFGTNPPGMRQNVIDFFAMVMDAPPPIVARMAALLRGTVPCNPSPPDPKSTP